MELKPASTASWVPGSLPAELAPGSARAILLFGPDQGGVFEFARLAGRAGGDCESYPAAQVTVDDAISSLSAGSLFGGATSVRIDGATDAHAARIEAILAAPFAEGARLIVSAGDLKATSKLKKLFSGPKDCLAVPLYLMREREISTFAQAFFKSQGLAVDRVAVQELPGRLSGDRAAAARACEVVALHVIGRGAATVSTLDLRAVLDEVDEEGMAAPLDHALAGRGAVASQACTTRLNAGESFVGLLRVFSQRIFRLRAMLETGLSPRDAVAKAKPPVFWAEKDMVTRLLSGLSLAKADRCLAMIDATERRIIENRIPAEAAMPALLWDIAQHRTWKD